MLSVSLKLPHEALRDLSQRVRKERLRLGWTQQKLADKSGIALPTYRRFEQTGQISLERFVNVMHTLGRAQEIENLAAPPEIRSLADLEEQSVRKRGISSRGTP